MGRLWGASTVFQGNANKRPYLLVLHRKIRTAGYHGSSILNSDQAQRSIVTAHQRERLMIFEHGAGGVEAISRQVVFGDYGRESMIGHADAGEWIDDVRIADA